MKKRIIFHCGEQRDLFSLLWAKTLSGKDTFFAEKKICEAVPKGWSPEIEDVWRRCTENSELNPLEEQASVAFIAELRERWEKYPDCPLLFVPFGQYVLHPGWLSVCVQLLRFAFPEAELQAFISIVRQDVAFELRFTAMLLAGDAPRWPVFWKNQSALPSSNYAWLLEDLFSIFGRSNVCCHISDVGKERACDFSAAALNSLKAFCQYADVDENDLLSVNWHPGAQFLRFCWDMNSLANESPCAQRLSWPAQTRHFGSFGSEAFFASPEERVSVVHKHAEENSAAARLLGRTSLFSPVDPAQDWQPQKALDAEAAFSVWEKLEEDFRLCLAHLVRTTPKEYVINYEPRMWLTELGHDFVRPSVFRESSQPKLSVLTMTYNHERYIGECIESVLAQETTFPIQHIISDDCSTDATRDVIMEYASRHKNIVPLFYPKKKKGRQNTVYYLFSMARTEYVALCDGDDYFTDPHKLQKQVDFLDTYRDCALCFHPVDVIYEDGSPSRVYPPEELLPGGVRKLYVVKDLLQGNMIQTNSAVYRWRFRSGLPEWFATTLCPGDWYWHLLHAELGPIGYLRERMSVYRRHAKAIYMQAEYDSSQHRKKYGISELRTYKVCNEHFKNRYFKDFCGLANGVFADFLKIYVSTGDDSLLLKACDLYPDFARHFLAEVHL